MSRFHDEAREEFGVAALWYEGQRAGLGFTFVQAVEEACESIVRNPQRFPLHALARRDRSFRFVTVDRFPYSVIYVETAVEIVYLAVAHHSRKPGYWRHRRA